MPELPEVETIVRQLKKRGVEQRKILAVRIDWPKMIAPYSYSSFSKKICGERIVKLSRKGKWIIFELSNKKYLLIHLRMSGSFSKKPSKYDRAEILLSGSVKLYYRDSRKFGKWIYTLNPSTILNKLGPDAMSKSFTWEYFSNLIMNKNRMIKPLLLDQAFIAGIGNIYADEALWLSKIHPKKIAKSINLDDQKKLYHSIKEVLKIGIRNRGTSLGKGKSNYKDLNGKSGRPKDMVKAYGRTGQDCERCSGKMEKIYVAQRGTTICPYCQFL